MEMKLLSSRYTKISVERNPEYVGKTSVKENIKIKSIENYKPEKAKDDLTKVTYEFSLNYGDLGKIEIEGILFLLIDSKTQKIILKNYEDKKINTEENVVIMNLIMQKVSLKAIALEDEFSFPAHISIPKVQYKAN